MDSKPRAHGDESVNVSPSGNRRFSEIVAEGEYRASLEALRDKLARDMEDVDSKVVAQVAAQLRSVLKEIAGLPDTKKVTIADDLARRRADRRAAARTSPLASGESH